MNYIRTEIDDEDITNYIYKEGIFRLIPHMEVVIFKNEMVRELPTFHQVVLDCSTQIINSLRLIISVTIQRIRCFKRQCSMTLT